MAKIEELSANIKTRFNGFIENIIIFRGELTLEVRAENLLEVSMALRDETMFGFNMLIDVCGVDYLHYGISEWETESATASGFERGVTQDNENYTGKRFVSVYHLLSIPNNYRIRLKVFLDEKNPVVPSVVHIWPAANWFEREAFDLFGIIYQGHPDLRRLLTDYGFLGHPFRKDFPLIGKVEARYDAKEQRVVYEPVSIEPRVLEPKVIRLDPRYESGENNG
ncbi:NADH-quinone oxidoreductase subunit C [Gammaproteobacteria bacterium]|nr:NADH-quinone oxidoreductase subunit C [Gammaproteobacteria bacterium]